MPPQFPALEPGLQMFPTPRATDAPGTIFRVTPAGVRYDVVDLSPLLQPSVSVETFAVLRDSAVRSIDAGVFLRFVTANTAARTSLNRQIATEFMLGGARREKITDQQIDLVLQPRLSEITWRPNDRYYVIRETILADSIRVRVDGGAANQLEQDATFRTLIADSVRVNWNRESSYQLVQKFSPAQRVLYKVDRIEPATEGFGGQPVTRVEYVPVSEPLTFSEVP